MKVYKKKISFIPFIYIISLICLITLIKIFLPPNYFEISIFLYGFIGLQLFIILFIHWIRYNSRFIIKKNSIIAKGLIKKKVRFNEIIGYKKEYWQSVYSLKYIVLKTNNEVFKNIKIHPSYINFIELQEWIETNFSDLDLVQEKKEWNQVLDNEKFGSNTLSRTFFVKQAKRIADILNYSAIILLLFLFFPSTHSYILIPALIIPIVSICAIFYFKGIIRLENFAKYEFKITKSKNNNPKVKFYDPSVYTSVFLAITLPTLVLLTIIIRDYNIVTYNGLWKESLIVSALIFLSCLMITKEFVFNKIKSYINLLIVFLVLFAYAFIGIIGINCVFDNSTPLKDTGVVVNKYSQLIKTYRYILVIKSPKLDKLVKIKVSKEAYEGLEAGNNFTFKIREGKFNIQWIQL